ncbi:hypothetical protein HK101_007239, partial [Irineochytrium annulatum]
VLIQGKKVLPAAVRALRRLNEKRVPFVLLTNGGGVTERVKAEELQGKFGCPRPITEHQVVLAHSPMRRLAKLYADKPVLVLGKDTCKDVALSYGLNHPILAEEIYSHTPSIWPFRRPPLPPPFQPSPPIDLTRDRIAAILLLHDSCDWGRDAQICVDLLRSDGGLLGTLNPRWREEGVQSVPLHAASADLEWRNEYPRNRLAQGAFGIALEALYAKLKEGDG